MGDFLFIHSPLHVEGRRLSNISAIAFIHLQEQPRWHCDDDEGTLN